MHRTSSPVWYVWLRCTPGAANRHGCHSSSHAAAPAPPAVQVRLLPHAMKDEESTHNCTQVFVVTRCQPRGLQVDVASSSYLLSPSDHFFVPQGTLYRLTNHSHDTDAEVSFVVIKPAP